MNGDRCRDTWHRSVFLPRNCGRSAIRSSTTWVNTGTNLKGDQAGTVQITEFIRIARNTLRRAPLHLPRCFRDFATILLPIMPVNSGLTWSDITYDPLSRHVNAKGKAVSQTGEGLPERISGSIAKKSDLRYGENPHHRGALYVMPGLAEGIAASEILHGMEMSYLNYVDADAAWDFEEPTCVIVKHATPCGLASHQEPSEAYARALAGDPISAYGGIVALNRPVDARVAETFRNTRNPLTGLRQLLHVVVAPKFSDEGLATLTGKSKDLRILRAPRPPQGGLRPRQISGGWLAQDDDDLSADEFEFEPVSQRHPTQTEMADLIFAWKACKHITSNAIAVAKDRVLVGAGAGQPNRVGSVKLALEAAGVRAHGSVMASDAYFPFADGVDMAAAGGIAAVVQPAGSLRDAEVIDAANRHGLALVVARRRHFRH